MSQGYKFTFTLAGWAHSQHNHHHHDYHLVSVSSTQLQWPLPHHLIELSGLLGGRSAEMSGNEWVRKVKQRVYLACLTHGVIFWGAIEWDSLWRVATHSLHATECTMQNMMTTKFRQHLPDFSPLIWALTKWLRHQNLSSAHGTSTTHSHWSDMCFHKQKWQILILITWLLCLARRISLWLHQFQSLVISIHSSVCCHIQIYFLCDRFATFIPYNTLSLGTLSSISISVCASADLHSWIK